MSDEREYPDGRFGSGVKLDHAPVFPDGRAGAKLRDLPEPAPSVAVGDSINIHYLEDDSRWEPTEILAEDVPIGAAVAKGLEHLERATISGVDADRRVRRLTDAVVSLQESEARLRQRVEARPDTLRGVARRAARDLADIARRRLWL